MTETVRDHIGNAAMIVDGLLADVHPEVWSGWRGDDLKAIQRRLRAALELLDTATVGGNK